MDKYEEASRIRLGEIASKRMKTCFIGDIAVCEELLGFLWGHGKNEDILTVEELQYRKLWEQVRNKMLTNGNNQIRSFLEELTHNTVIWNRYQTTFVIKKD